ncbi:MAG: hypothetical protein M3018_09870 [Actinomycetota bacterium]|nr:hypothetical protein [Actinomycetota bacterium]
MTRLTIAVAAWIGAVIGALALSNAVAHQIGHQVAGAQTANLSSSDPQTANLSSTDPIPVQSFDPQAVKPTDAVSLFRKRNFAAALGIARRHFGARVEVEQLVLRPGQMQLIVITHGSRRVVVINADRAFLDSEVGLLTGTTDVFRLSEVQPGVPAAVERRIAVFGHVRPARLNYMILQTDPIAHRFNWLIYPKGSDVHFQADGATGPIQVYGRNGARTLSG